MRGVPRPLRQKSSTGEAEKREAETGSENEKDGRTVETAAPAFLFYGVCFFKIPLDKWQGIGSA